jgi:hypothetical protein
MAFLRRVLGNCRDVVKVIPERGYIFTAKVDTETVENRASALPDPDCGARLPEDCSSNGATVRRQPARQGDARPSSTAPGEQLPPTVVINDDDDQDVREGLAP